MSYRTSLNKGLSGVFLLIRREIHILERKTTEYVPFSSHLWLAWPTIVYAQLGHWLRKHLLGFSTINWLPSSPLDRPLWKEVIICSPLLRNTEFCSTSLRREYLHKLFWILLYGKFIYSPPSIYLSCAFKLNWRDEKTKSRVQIHQTGTPDYSVPVKLLCQVVQKRSELSFDCGLGIGREEGSWRGAGKGRGEGERERERERERDQGMREIPALNKNLG